MFFEAVKSALLEQQADQKCLAIERMAKELADAPIPDNKVPAVMQGLDTPGRPPRPALVAPRLVARRSLHTSQGRAALIHSIAHIEFNAINLALDAIWRFRGLPEAYYRDWLSVAVDEARHFCWLKARLESLDMAYGDFPAHNGLWEAALKTAHDPLLRMALVPRVLEARGLDVTPGMIERLEACGDTETAILLTRILEEEVGHVAIGTRWFRYICAQRGLDPDNAFVAIVTEHMHPLPKGPFNFSGRLSSGFSETEMRFLEQSG